MKLRLPNSIASLQDLTTMTLEIQEYAQWFKHESIKKRVNAKRMSESPTMSPSALELLQEWGGKNPLSQQSLDDLINALKEYSNSAPSITMTLAAPPTSDVKKVLVGWCRRNIAPNIMVTFRFNSTLLGGMVVHYGSRIFDWSFRRQVLAARERFPEVLRRV